LDLQTVSALGSRVGWTTSHNNEQTNECLCASHMIHASLDSSKFKTQTASRSVQPFCMAHGSVVGHARAYPFPIRMGYVIHASFDPPECTSHTPSCRLSRFCTAHGRMSTVHILYNGTALSSLIIAPSHGGICTPI